MTKVTLSQWNELATKDLKGKDPASLEETATRAYILSHFIQQQT